LKPERWGSLLVQEKYQEEMPVTRDIHNNNNNNNNNKNNNIFSSMDVLYLIMLLVYLVTEIK
jgi:hypothetical protein